MNKDIQFQIECLTSELVEMLIERYNWDILKAMDVLYASETFAKLNDPKCGLYYQGPVYVFDYLKDEIELGRIA